MNKLDIVLPEDRGGIVAAVSGGADSVAMLLLLHEACRAHCVCLTAAHFEHGIRAEASLADAAFVRRLCQERGIELIEGSADVPALAAERSVGIEEAARDARYEFLRQAKRQAGAKYIALAHHQDDQAETVLMHLLRGCGLRGLVGMSELEGDLYRPLIGVSKQTLVDFLTESGVSWREDATNYLPDNPRNALRINVFPQLEMCYPAAKRAICRFSDIAAEENAFMEAETDRFLENYSARLPFGWLILLPQDEEIHRAILMRAVHRLTQTGHEAVLRAVQLCGQKKGACELDGTWRAERGRLGLYLIEQGKSVQAWEYPLSQGGEVFLGAAGTLKTEQGSGIPVTDDRFCQELNAEELQGAVVRTRRNGDVIHPLGAAGRQKLKEYFINRRIDRPLRDVIPLIAKGSRILWVMGEGIAEEAKLTQENGKSVRVTLHGGVLRGLWKRTGQTDRNKSAYESEEKENA